MSSICIIPEVAGECEGLGVRLGVMSGGGGWHAADLERAAAARGHDVRRLDFRTLSAAIGCAGVADECDALLVRTMPLGSLEQVVFRMNRLHSLAARGLTILNPPRALEVCIDKYWCLAELERAGLRVPPTVVCQTAEQARRAFVDLGGRVVVKPLFGSEGRGMVRLEDAEMAWRTFHALEALRAVMYVQTYIDHAGWDARIFVLRGRVLASMRRVARGDWRTNTAQGARAEAYVPPPIAVEMALRAAEAVGAVAAGVDLLPDGGGGWYVLEVNAVPGWRSLAPVSGVDVADALVRVCEEKRLSTDDTD